MAYNSHGMLQRQTWLLQRPIEMLRRRSDTFQ